MLKQLAFITEIVNCVLHVFKQYKLNVDKDYREEVLGPLLLTWVKFNPNSSMDK